MQGYDCCDVGVYGMGFDPYSETGWNPETGWFGSKLVKKVSRAVSAPVRAVAKGATFVGKNVGKGVVAAAKGIAPIAATALPYVQQVMKATGPIGMIASGAAGALAATVKGQSLESIAWAAAEGASPPGIDRAVMAAKALRQGQPVINVAVNAARQSFAPGSVGQRAFDIGVAAAKGGTKEALANARRQLTSSVQHAAFDSAVGTLSKAAKGLPAVNRISPALPIMRSVRTLAVSPHSQMTNLALSAMRNNPRLARMQPALAAKALNIPYRRVWEARGLYDAGMMREAGMMHETGTVTDSVKPYKLKSGDIPYQLAQKMTGNQNRWREIPAVNKVGLANYKGSKDMVVKNVVTTDKKTGKKTTTTLLDPFYSGLDINLPGDWNVAGAPTIVIGVPGTAPPPTAPPVTSTPYPTPLPPQLPPPTPVGTKPESPIPFPLPPQPNGQIPMPGPLPGTIPVGNKPDSPIPMPGPVTIPGTTSPVPMPMPPVSTTPSTPPLTPEQKKKKDATAMAIGAVLLGGLFFV